MQSGETIINASLIPQLDGNHTLVLEVDKDQYKFYDIKDVSDIRINDIINSKIIIKINTESGELRFDFTKPDNLFIFIVENWRASKEALNFIINDKKIIRDELGEFFEVISLTNL